MTGRTPREVEEIQNKAKREEKEAERAREVVQKALTKMNPQRQHDLEADQEIE